MPREIPKDDVKLINDSLKQGIVGQAVTKDAEGKVIGTETKVVNEKGFKVIDFRGRVLKHDKYVIPKGGKQTLIASKGDKFDDIPLQKRDQIYWSESDFS